MNDIPTQVKVLIIPEEKYLEMLNELHEIKKALAIKNSDGKQIIDNDTFLKLLNISKRTGVTWRSTGIIGYSKIDGKIFYRLSDIDDMLKNHYNKAFKQSKYK